MKREGGKWVKGTTGNPSGRPQLPADLRELKAMFTKELVEATFIKYMLKGVHELHRIANEEMTLPALDHIIIQVIVKAGLDGDVQRLNFLLDRTVGKVVEKTENHDYKININAQLDKVPEADLVMILKKSNLEQEVYDVSHET